MLDTTMTNTLPEMNTSAVLDEKVGAVLVVGGGIAGMQASLDLGDNGFKVYLLDKSPSIGGVMAQLDKTFPTNDCAMCIMAPKLVGTGRHHNITLKMSSEIETLEGSAGNFTVTLKRNPRRINPDKCTGCGICAQNCPIEAFNEYNENLTLRKAIYVNYPQAVPLVYSIDKNVCIGCGICNEVCKAGAVEYDQEEMFETLKVGSIILCPGFDEFNPSQKKEYGYGVYKNVITSIELERILSPSGPFGGHVLRFSDGKEAQNIAFIQCVGSRDLNTNPYCSSVCCMYAIKEAIIAQEHTPGLKSHIFAMDIRACGKGFENFSIRAEDEYKVEITRNCRIAAIEEIDNEDLLIRYIEDGERKEKKFDMVVLSVGLEPTKGAAELAETFGIELNEYGFCATSTFEPLSTSKPGIFVGGAFSGPKDIPETVAQASAVAAKASSIIASERNKLIQEKEYPEEIDVSAQEPRVGVFVCHCGINIGGVVDVPAVMEYAKTLPNVVLSDANLYTCSQDTQDLIKSKIEEYNLNRVVVASCTPRTHEPLFQDTIREAGLNPYLFEMANIRDQCSWVHMHQPEEATTKAKDLVRMMVAKAVLLQPLKTSSVKPIPSALVIGGGLAGMTAADEISKQGFNVELIEKTDSLGGHLKQLTSTLDGDDPQALLRDLVKRIEKDPRITVRTGVELENLEGYVGNFNSTLTGGITLEHGTIIVATGADEYKPIEYLYGTNPNVMTQLEFEQHLEKGDIHPTTVAIMHCVGARNENNSECGRICCATSIKTALKIKDKLPNTSVYNLFKDMRTYGFREKYYQEAAEKGVHFIRYKNEHQPVVTSTDSGLEVSIMDAVLNRDLLLRPDIIVLSATVVPDPNNTNLAKLLKVPLGKEGFFLEGHVKLRPLDFATDGIFVCGMAHSPKFIDETISQACGAVSRACTIMSKEEIEASGVVSSVNEDICRGCGTCEGICPYGAITVDMSDPTDLIAKVNEILCKGCGSCSASCPEHAIAMKHFSNEQIMAQIKALMGVA